MHTAPSIGLARGGNLVQCCRMKFPIRPMALAAFAFAAMQDLHAQIVPTGPNKFTTRGLGDRGEGLGSVGFSPVKPQTTSRTVTHIALGDARQWKVTDGRTFVGKLIAFEDIVSESKVEKGAQPVPAAAPAIPAKPTVVKDDKARLLVAAKVYEMALASLGEEDRKFIEGIRAGIAAKK